MICENALVKAGMLSAKKMVDRNSTLSRKRRCAILQPPRSTAYYEPAELSESDHGLIRRIDERHLQYQIVRSRFTQSQWNPALIRRIPYIDIR